MEIQPLEPLTDRQLECLTYIYKYFVEKRYYPTQREIGSHMKVRPTAASIYTKPLVKKGYIFQEPNRHRNIRLTEQALSILRKQGVIKEEEQLGLV